MHERHSTLTDLDDNSTLIFFVLLIYHFVTNGVSCGLLDLQMECVILTYDSHQRKCIHFHTHFRTFCQIRVKYNRISFSKLHQMHHNSQQQTCSKSGIKTLRNELLDIGLLKYCCARNIPYQHITEGNTK